MLEFSDVSYSYGSVPALQGLSFSFRPGERVALLGPSGAGKSTLLRLAGTMLAPDAGTVTFQGRDLQTLGVRQLRSARSAIGTIYQNLDLVDELQVVHNVNAGRLAGWSACTALLSLIRPAGLGLVREVLSMVGLQGQEFRRVAELSGGQQQRVAIARVLAGRPGMVLADEPVSRLDQENSRKVMELVCRPDGPQLVLSAMHDVSLALRYHDRIIGLKGGRLQFDLPATDVSDTLIRDLYEDDHG